jgi:hypothetical protein
MVSQIRLLSAAAVFATLAMAPLARADGGTLLLEGDCYLKVGTECVQACGGPIDCNIQFAEACSVECTKPGSTSCVDRCQTECSTDAGSFRCSTDCAGHCETLCSDPDTFGSASQTDCVAACQAECAVGCKSSPPSSVCSTACPADCAAQENIPCSVRCQMRDLPCTTITPVACADSCGDTSGVVVCNGQVVAIHEDTSSAAAWVASTLDTQAPQLVDTGASCKGEECEADPGCASVSGSKTSNFGIFGVGIAFAAIGIARRKGSRR